MPRPSRDLAERLAVFVDAGLLPTIPTRWQLTQGEVEMSPYVVSTDATADEGYRLDLRSHPVIRQVAIGSHIGLDHFITGAALGAKLTSVCAHLLLTFHRGMPVFDLQVVQTHPGGLSALRTAIDEALTGATPLGRRRWAISSRILVDAPGYYGQFLGADGWIARAERFAYPTEADEGSAFPPEFWSLVAFLRYCVERFPATPDEPGWPRMPAHLLRLATRRFREGRGFGWFGRGAEVA